MATIAWIANASTGNWSTPANWSGGSLPTINDEVAIGTNGNSGTGITSAAASSGATSVTLSGTSVNLKRGAIIAIAGTVGLYALRSDRSGNGAVSIDPPLRAAVSASSAVTYYNGGAECVVDTDAVCGGDSRYGLLVSTVLKASRSVSTTLTCRGSISVIQQTCRLDYGSPADPIPAGVNAGILFDLGASPTANKYGLLIGRPGQTDPTSPSNTADCGGVYMWGATKTPYSDMSVGITAGGSTFTVPDATGWAIGDRVAVPPSGSYTNQETRVISSITGAGPYEVTVSAPWTYAHAAGLPAMNLTRNVYVGVASSAQPACVHVHAAATATPDSYRIGYVEFATGGGPTVVGGLAWISTTVWTAATVPWRDIVGCSFHHRMRDGTNIATHIGVGPSGNAITTWPLTWDRCVFFEEARLGINVALIAGALYYLNDCVSVGGSYGIFSGFSQGGQGSIFNRLRLYGAGTCYNPNPCINLEFNDCTFDNYNIAFLPQSGACLFNRGAIGQTYQAGANLISYGSVANQSITATFTDTYFPAGVPLLGDSDFVKVSASFKFRMINRDADATKQEEWTRPGVVVRDNSTINRSRSAVKLTLKSSTVAKVWSVPFAVAAGSPVRVIGYVQHDATYGSANPVAVSLSGAGSTPATFTAATSAGAWQKFDLTVTPAVNGTLTLAVTALSDAVNGNVWIDGVSHAPWIDWSWHYGMAYTPAVPYVTVEPNIVATEATAIAYPGFAWSSGTLTVSASHTGQELYDWHAAYCAANQLAPFVTGTPAQPVVAGDLVVTGSGVVLTATKVTATGTVTLSSGGSIAAGSYQSSAGLFVALSVSSLVAGSRIQLYNVTDAGEIYNAVVAGTSYSQYVQYTADKTVRLRATKTNGVTAKAPYEATGTLTANGLAFTAAQVECPVYDSYGIDGSTVTGFAADYTHDEVDLTVAANFYIMNLFAWWCYNLTTAQGIADFFGGITPVDEGNIQVNDSIVSIFLDNTTSTDVWALDNRRFFRADGARPVKNPTTGGGGIDVEWREKVLFVNDPDITAIRNLVEADEIHTPTAIQKRQRGTATVLLEKAWTGKPLKDFQAVQP